MLFSGIQMDLIFPSGDDLMTTSLTPICGWSPRKVTKNRVTEKCTWICGPKKLHMLCKILAVKLIAPFPFWDKKKIEAISISLVTIYELIWMFPQK